MNDVITVVVMSACVWQKSGVNLSELSQLKHVICSAVNGKRQTTRQLLPG